MHANAVSLTLLDKLEIQFAPFMNSDSVSAAFL